MFQQNEVFWPRETTLWDIWLHSVGWWVAGVVGSVFLLIVVFGFSGLFPIQHNFNSVIGMWQNTSALFPLFLSFMSFLAGLIVLLLQYKFSTMIDIERYKSTVLHYGNICFLSLILYIFIAPIYIWSGMIDYNNILTVFLIHMILLSFGSHLLTEILNNYRYVLVWFYASFASMLLSGIIVFSIFFYFETGFAKLLSLLFILPLTTFLSQLFTGFFQYVYYKYYKFTWNDQMWDIFYQIEQEEKEKLNQTY